MADFPTTVYNPRTKENRSGVVYNPLKPKVLFAEDIVNLDNEVVAIEEFLMAPPKFFDVPTSPSGLSAGDVWCDTTGGNNILKLVL
jgi:hypothetical protein